MTVLLYTSVLKYGIYGILAVYPLEPSHMTYLNHCNQKDAHSLRKCCSLCQKKRLQTKDQFSK